MIRQKATRASSFGTTFLHQAVAGTCAAENQEATAPRPAIRQHTEYGEQIWHVLDFVQYHESPQVSKCKVGIGEPCQVRRGLQIEPVTGAFLFPGDRLCKGRLADLPGTENGHHGELLQPPEDLVTVGIP